MGGVTNLIGYVSLAVVAGYLLKSTDYISWKIDERRAASQHEERLNALARSERQRLLAEQRQGSS